MRPSLFFLLPLLTGSGHRRRGGGDQGQQRAARTPPCGAARGRGSQVQRAPAPSWGLGDPRAQGGRPLALRSPVPRTRTRAPGLPRARQPRPCLLPSQGGGARATAAATRPRRPRRRGARAADPAGTWARLRRRAGRWFRLGPTSASPPGACGWREGSSPCHFAPVRGNLRSVTRILQRATCSAGRAARGGIAALGRRGLGTPRSGGHAGVGAPRRPAAAAR